MDEARRLITLRYRNARGEPDPKTQVPPFTCEFLVAARLNGAGPKYDATAIFDGAPHRATIAVEGRGAIRIRYEGEPGGCVNTAGPELAGGLDAPGVLLEFEGEGRKDTKALRAVRAARAPFHSTPDGPVTRAHVVAGDTVRVIAERPGWVQAVYEAWSGRETSGWLSERDLFPLP